MDRGLLAMAGVPKQAAVEADAGSSGEGRTDAEINALGEGRRRLRFREELRTGLGCLSVQLPRQTAASRLP